jgi:hypothetical protein
MALTKVTQHSLGNSAVTTAKLGTAPFGFANSSANVVFMAANGSVGIGTNTPSYKVHAQSTSVDVAYAFTDTATSTSAVGYNGSGSTNGVGAPAGTMYMSSYNSVPIVFGNGNTERMRIDASGRVTTPYQPAVVAAVTSNKTIGSGTPLQFDSIVLNRNSAITVSATNSRFAAPIAGYYVVSFSFFCSGTNDSAVDLRVNGSNFYRIGHNIGGLTGTASNLGGSAVVIFNLSAGDYIDIAGSGTKTILGASPVHSVFSMYLLG